MQAAPALPDMMQYGAGVPEVVWRPLSAPQEAFLHATESEVLYGGAKGGAKTESLVVAAAMQIDKPGYKALLLRHTFPELQEIQDRADAIYPALGGQWKAGEMRYQFPGGATIELGYCEMLKHVTRYQGREFAFIGFDEIGNLREERVWDRLLAELRSPNAAIQCYARCTGNPGGAGHAWLKRRFIAPCGHDGATTYVDPVTGLTRRFIPAKVRDNPVYAQDARYLAQLTALPERMRRQLLDGDWDVGEGLALDELSRSSHWVPWRMPAPHWVLFGALDWGYQHKFAFGLFGVDEDGVVHLIESVHGWRLLPHEQIERVRDTLELRHLTLANLRYCVGGHDVKNVIQARGERTPSLQEQYRAMGLNVTPVQPSRIQSLDNMRRYLSVRRSDGTLSRPRFVVMDTPGNAITFDCLASMVVDPDNVEDALKVDTDPMTGEGGDDPYDMVRYALSSRPLAATAPQPAPKQGQAPPLNVIAKRHAPEQPKRAALRPPPDPSQRPTYRAGLASR